jgi:hypothetical protein
MRAVPVLFAIVVVILSGSCSVDDERPRPTEPTRVVPSLEDQQLRTVRMTSGRALSYVSPTTASQILCQVLDKASWERLLDSQVGRAPLEYPDAGCRIATERGLLRVQLRESDDAFPAATTTVAGRPATTVDRPGGHVLYLVALTDDALHAAPWRGYPALRTLEVEATGGEPDRGIALRVLTEIVPLLAKDGDPLPAIDENGEIVYAYTPLTGGDQFVDLPLPTQGVQLCTVLLRAEGFRLPADHVSVMHSGECTLRTGQASVSAGTEPVLVAHGRYRDRVGGRPAAMSPDGSRVEVLLRDDDAGELMVSGPDCVGLAEKLVPLLTG